MKRQLLNLLASSKGRYLLVGGSVYLLELAVIALAVHSGASSVSAVALSFVIGLMVSFGLQKFVTFRDRRTQRRIVGVQIAAVVALVIWNFGFTVLLAHLLPLAPTISRTIALLITTIWNYYLYKTRIFHNGVTV